MCHVTAGSGRLVRALLALCGTVLPLTSTAAGDDVFMGKSSAGEGLPSDVAVTAPLELWLVAGARTVAVYEFRSEVIAGEAELVMTGLAKVVDHAEVVGVWFDPGHPSVKLIEYSVKSDPQNDRTASLVIRYSAERAGTISGRYMFRRRQLKWAGRNLLHIVDKNTARLVSELRLMNRTSGLAYSVDALHLPCAILGSEGGHISTYPMAPSKSQAGEDDLKEYCRVVGNWQIPHGFFALRTFEIGVTGIKKGFQVISKLDKDRGRADFLSSGYISPRPASFETWVLTLEGNLPAEGIGLLPAGITLVNPKTRAGSLAINYAAAWKADGRTLTMNIPTNLITARRSQLQFKAIVRGASCKEHIALTVENRMEQKATVEVLEPLFRSKKYTVEKASSVYQEVDGPALKFRALLGPKETRTIEYEVLYEKGL